MEKKFVINRVDLGQRVTGYELLNPGVNGSEILGYTPKQMMDAVKGGEVVGMVMNAAGVLVMDEAKGFHAMMVKTGVGTLTSSDPNAIANIMYTVYARVDGDEDKFKVISSRFGRLVYCGDKIKALLDLGAINGVVMEGDKLKCAWELEDASKAPELEGTTVAVKLEGKKK